MDYATAFCSLYYALYVLGWAMLLRATTPFIRKGYIKLKPLSLLQCAEVMASYACYVGAVAVDNCAVLLTFTAPRVPLSIIAAMGAFAVYGYKCNHCVTPDSNATRSSLRNNTNNTASTTFNACMASIRRCINTSQTTVRSNMQQLSGLLLYVFWTAAAEFIAICIAFVT
jgi:hypothetical protein